MKRIYFIAACLVWMVTMPILGQEKLTPNQIKAMKEVGIKRVESFQDDLSKYIMNTKLKRADRMDRAHTHTKLLFIDENRIITVTDSDGNVFYRGLMEYFRRASLLSYTTIDVTFSQLHYGTQFKYNDRISRERGGDWYTATVVFQQDFTGWRGKEATFSDRVERVMTVYIEKVTEQIGGKSVDSYHALLGDSKVTEIKYKAQ